MTFHNQLPAIYMDNLTSRFKKFTSNYFNQKIKTCHDNVVINSIIFLWLSRMKYIYIYISENWSFIFTSIWSSSIRFNAWGLFRGKPLPELMLAFVHMTLSNTKFKKKIQNIEFGYCSWYFPQFQCGNTECIRDLHAHIWLRIVKICYKALHRAVGNFRWN